MENSTMKNALYLTRDNWMEVHAKILMQRDFVSIRYHIPTILKSEFEELLNELADANDDLWYFKKRIEIYQFLGLNEKDDYLFID